MEEIITILADIRPDINFEEERSLVDDGLLDSFDIVAMISELNDHFDIAIRVTQLDPENFNSVEAIYSMCKNLQEKP